jgi:hypothetical protein
MEIAPSMVRSSGLEAGDLAREFRHALRCRLVLAGDALVCGAAVLLARGDELAGDTLSRAALRFSIIVVLR